MLYFCHIIVLWCGCSEFSWKCQRGVYWIWRLAGCLKVERESLNIVILLSSTLEMMYSIENRNFKNCQSFCGIYWTFVWVYFELWYLRIWWPSQHALGWGRHPYIYEFKKEQLFFEYIFVNVRACWIVVRTM